MNIKEFFDLYKLNKVDACKDFFVNEENILKAIALDISLLEFVPEELRTLELYRKASDISPHTFLYMPKAFRDDTFVLRNILPKVGSYFRYCSDDIKSHPYFVRLAVRGDWYAIKYADEKLLTDRDFCISMIKTKPQCIKYFCSFWNDEKIMLPLCHVYNEFLKYLDNDMKEKYEEKYWREDAFKCVDRMFPETWEEGIERTSKSKFGGMYMNLECYEIRKEKEE